jgi:WD40 repeat protein
MKFRLIVFLLWNAIPLCALASDKKEIADPKPDITSLVVSKIELATLRQTFLFHLHADVLPIVFAYANMRQCATIGSGAESCSVMSAKKDGSEVATAGNDGVFLWDTKTSSSKRIKESSANKVSALAYNEDALLAIGYEDGMIDVWDTKTGVCDASAFFYPWREKTQINSLRFSDTYEESLSICADTGVFVIRYKKLEICNGKYYYKNHRFYANNVYYSIDTPLLDEVYLSVDSVHYYEGQNKHHYQVSCIDIPYVSTSLAVSGKKIIYPDKGRICISEGKKTEILPGEVVNDCKSLALAADGDYLVAGCADRKVVTVSLKDWKRLDEFTLPSYSDKESTTQSNDWCPVVAVSSDSNVIFAQHPEGRGVHILSRLGNQCKAPKSSDQLSL